LNEIELKVGCHHSEGEERGGREESERFFEVRISDLEQKLIQYDLV